MQSLNNVPRGHPDVDEAKSLGPNAKWMKPSTLAAQEGWQFNAQRLMLGVTEDGKLIGSGDDRHLVTVAGSRAGKGRSTIVPNLLMYKGSMLVLDPKGENANLTATRRGDGESIPDGGLGQDVFVIDPFNAADKVPAKYRAGFNPISYLDPTSETFVDDCEIIADALVMTTGQETTTFFNDTARFIIRGFIAWIATFEDEARRNLREVHTLLHLSEKKFLQICDLMADEDNAELGGGLPGITGDTIGGMDKEERSRVMSTVRQHIGFLESPPMADTLSSTQRQPDLTSWKMGGQTVYLCLPASRLQRHARFFRLFLNQLINASEDDRKPPCPAVMMLDEMHVLGRMQILETAAALVAGFGIRIWSIWQDFNQLEAIYGKRWETFVGNAGVFQSFGLNDTKTLRYVSDRLGQSSMMKISHSEISTEQRALGFTGKSQSIENIPLMSMDEIAKFFSRQAQTQLIISPGLSPMFLHRLNYDHDFFKAMRAA